MKVLIPLLFSMLLACFSTPAFANEAAIDAALDAIVSVGEQAAESAHPDPVTKPSPDRPTPGEIVQVNRTDLDAWMQQQQIQANVITNQSNNQLWTTSLLAAVWLITFVMLLRFMHRQGCKDYVNVIGLNLIIFATVFMVLVVETDQQLTAGAGILGAIAGYLFRAMQGDPQTASNDTEKS